MLSEIDALNSLMRGPVPGLSLSAGWSKAKGFELDIYLPVPTKLNLGNGITTTPFKLALVTKPTAELILSAGLNIPVAHSSEPLLFTLSLGASMLSAEATGQMTGWWENPLGTVSKVKVGPNLWLSSSIIYSYHVPVLPPLLPAPQALRTGASRTLGLLAYLFLVLI